MLKIVRRVFRLAGGHRKELLLSFIAGFMESLMPSLSYLLIFLSFRRYLRGEIRLQGILQVTVLLLCTLFLRFIFKWVEYRLQSGIGYEMICDKRLELGDKLLRLPMGFYNDTDAGEVSSVINDDLVFVEGMAMSFLSKVTGAIISTVLLTLALWILDFRIALLALFACPFAWTVHRRAQRIYEMKSKDRQAAHAAASSVMLEYLHGVHIIKAFRMVGIQKKRLEDVLQRLEIVSYNFEMKSMPLMALYFGVFHLFTALLLLAVSILFLKGSFSLEMALVLVIIVFSFYAPMEILGISSGILRLMNECLNRMETIMETPVLDEHGNDTVPNFFDVRFHKVSFSYGERQVLTDISFYAPEKSLTAIVGPSGSGKSTILSLIARFYDVKHGHVEIGGVDVRDMKCGSVLNHISFIFQRPYLFHDTVEANIKLGNPRATFDDVLQAARKAHCHEFIEKLENGYKTVIGEGGGTLSGGERQRIAIARALLKDAPIILLDEVTASIDPENEVLIQQAINEVVKEKTVFVVAHKLSVIKHANRIIVLNKSGCVRESGTHGELLRKEGLYAELWEKSRRIVNWSIDTE